MPDNTAQYTEVLSLQVALDAFKADLDKAADLYKQFKQDVGNDTVAIGAGNFQGVVDGLKSIETLIKDISLESQQELSNLASTISKAFETVGSKAKKAIKDAQDEAEGSINPLVELEGEPQSKKAKEFYRILLTEQEGVTNKAAEDAEALAERQKKLAQDIAAEQQSLQDQFLEKQLADEAKIAEARKKLAEDIAAEQQGLLDKYEAEREAADVKAEERRRAAQKRFDEERLDYLTQVQAEQQRAEDKQNNARPQLEFFESTADNLPRVAQFAIEWQIVGAAINAATAVIEAPFKAIKEGNEYLAKTKNYADELLGSLLANVKFSEDLAQNFKDAEGSAYGVVKALQDVSAATGLKFDNLYSSFSTLLEAGGARGVQDLQGLVKLTEEFNLAMRASGASAQTTRRLVSELPQLLNGTLPPTSKLLEVLHLTSEQAKTLVAEGIKHHDLLQRLEPAIRPYLSAVDQAAVHQEVMTEKLSLLKERVEAAFSAPISNTWIRFLETINKLLTDNADKIEKYARFAGIAFGALLFGPGNYGLGAQILSGAGGPEQEADLTKKITDISNHPGLDKPKHENSDITDELKEYRNTLDEIKVRFQEVKQSQEEFFASGKRSKADIADAIDQDVAERLRQVAAAYDDVIQKLDTSEVSELGKATSPEERENIGKRYRGARLDAAKAEFDAMASLNKDRISAEKDAMEELLKVKKVNLDKALALAKEEARAEEELAQQRFQRGEITETRLLDIKIAALKKQHDLDEESLEAEILTKAKGTEVRAQLEAKAAEDSKTFHDQYIRLLDERVVAERNATLVRQGAAAQYADRLLSSAFNARRTSEGATGVSRSNTGLYDAQEHSIQLLIQQKQAEIDIIQSKLRQGEVTDELIRKQRELLELSIEQRQTALQAQISQIQQSTPSRGIQTALIEAAYRQQLTGAHYQYSEANAEYQSAKAQGPRQGESEGDYAKRLADLADKTQTLGAASGQLAIQFEEFKGDLNDVGGGFSKLLLGTADLKDAWDKATTTTQKAEVAIGAFGSAFSAITNGITAFKQGKAQGGTLGGIGAIASQVGAYIPGPVGQAISGIGQVFSFVGSIFAEQAKHIADNIKKQFDAAIQAFSTGQTTLSQTIQSVLEERTQAINQLSGAKGGKEQLATLLPQLNNELAQLYQQQRQIGLDFANSFNEIEIGLQRGTDGLNSIYERWQQINKQVYDYINAGGDAATAMKYLSDVLEQIQITQQQALNEGEQQAVQDALQLNSLLRQRTQLLQSLNQQAFDLQNQDAEERTQAGSVSRANQLKQLQRESQLQLEDLNYQITTAQAKVSAESKVFDIATTVADLHRQDDALTLASLELQLNKYTAIQEVVSSITKDANGVFTSTIQWLNPNTNPILQGSSFVFNNGAIVMNFYGVATSEDGGQQAADAFTQAVQDAARSGAKV